jgi:hypothetical protein
VLTDHAMTDHTRIDHAMTVRGQLGRPTPAHRVTTARDHRTRRAHATGRTAVPVRDRTDHRRGGPAPIVPAGNGHRTRATGIPTVPATRAPSGTRTAGDTRTASGTRTAGDTRTVADLRTVPALPIADATRIAVPRMRGTDTPIAGRAAFSPRR